MKDKIALIAGRLRDERSRKVLLVSHCILNENTRYLGGAFAPGIRPEIAAELGAADYGVVQLQCPEQLAWGGVLKPLMWLPVGTSGRPSGAVLRLLFPLFMLRTRLIYRRLAIRTAKAAAEYARSGFEIVGFVGVDGSPTCGVNYGLDMRSCFALHSRLDPDGLARDAYNRCLYSECGAAGPGMFTAVLERMLGKKGLRVRCTAVDLRDELQGKKLSLGTGAM